MAPPFERASSHNPPTEPARSSAPLEGRPAPPRRFARLAAAVAPQRFGAAVCALALVALTLVYAASPPARLPEADGHYAWLFARSLVFDGDIHFENDYRLCGDFWDLGRDRGPSGRPDNPFYVGPSFFWVPLLAVARVVVPMKPMASEAIKAGCRPPYTAFVFYFAVLFAVLVLWFSYRAARRFVGDGAAAAAAGLIGLGGSLVAYAVELPSFTHVYSALAMSALALATLRAAEAPERLGRWAAAAGALGLVVLCRPTDAVAGALPAVVAAATLWKRWGRLAAALLLLGAGMLVGFAPILLVYKYLYGKFFAVPQGPYFMQFSRPHPFLLLFAPHGGLLYMTPALWLGLVGIVFAVRDHRRQRPFVLAASAVVALSVYVNASAIDWHASGTYGARRLTVLTPLFVVFCACLCERIAAMLRARPGVAVAAAGALAVAPIAARNIKSVWAQRFHLMPIERAPTQVDLYSGAERKFWGLFDDQVGPLAVLPAALVFRLRYGLPMTEFRHATETHYYSREPIYLGWRARAFPIDSNGLRLSTGMKLTAGALTITKPRATLVYAAMWPYATHVWLQVSAAKPTRLKIGRRTLFGTRFYGEIDVPEGPPEQPRELPIPPGGFSSGINEFVFEPADPAAEVAVQAFHLDDRKVYPKRMP